MLPGGIALVDDFQCVGLMNQLLNMLLVTIPGQKFRASFAVQLRKVHLALRVLKELYLGLATVTLRGD